MLDTIELRNKDVLNDVIKSCDFEDLYNDEGELLP